MRSLYLELLEQICSQASPSQVTKATKRSKRKAARKGELPFTFSSNENPIHGTPTRSSRPTCTVHFCTNGPADKQGWENLQYVIFSTPYETWIFAKDRIEYKQMKRYVHYRPDEKVPGVDIEVFPQADITWRYIDDATPAEIITLRAQISRTSTVLYRSSKLDPAPRQCTFNTNSYPEVHGRGDCIEGVTAPIVNPYWQLSHLMGITPK